MKICFAFRPMRPVQRPVIRSSRNDDHSPSYAKPSARPAPARNKGPPSRQQKKGSAPPKPGANAKPKVDTGIKNKVCCFCIFSNKAPLSIRLSIIWLKFGIQILYHLLPWKSPTLAWKFCTSVLPPPLLPAWEMNYWRIEKYHES